MESLRKVRRVHCDQFAADEMKTNIIYWTWQYKNYWREEHMKTYTVVYSFRGGKQTTSPGIDTALKKDFQLSVGNTN